MEDLSYIFGEPIEIEGFKGLPLYPMSVLEFTKNNHLFNVFNVGIKLLLQQVETSQKEERENIEKNIKDFDVLCMDVKNIFTLIQILKLSFKIKEDDDFGLFQEENSEYLYLMMKNYRIDRNNYSKLRNEIIKINNIRLPKVAKTKELQEWFDADALAKKSDNSDVNMQDIITSIMAYCSYTPKQLSEFTVYQINQLIARINKICEYEANIQFLCVDPSNKSIKLDGGIMAHIDDGTEEKITTAKDVVSKYQGMINNK